MYRIRGVNFLHEEMNSISNMLSFRSSMNVICTCCVGEICMNKILFKPNVGGDFRYYYYYYTNAGGDFRFCNYATTFSDISNETKIKIIRKNVFVGTLKFNCSFWI